MVKILQAVVLPSLCRSPGWEAHYNANSGSYNCNYRGTFSIVLLAAVDAECRSIYMLAAMEDLQMVGFSTDAAYTKHWKLALLCFPRQYLYLVGHRKFPIPFLQIMHLL
jgi:hypothetical protein